ncbi:protein translocase subunit secY/sec61 alpha [Caloranaerobacter azorensis DSM 13643]|uniref:Protein translocase subunit SecY n=1 Tax=Caloranaerobacter azorensis DSM 13643 TaxID=1121264 RepID=A0A1M5TYS5_9FIRM|nr:preprotein translocase subunit SecY [Caloranaerobacter azorensis]SHH55937.1 protein translocase subunit secY/sec61 alpha [Caloranaerobacter azorensis DSM 13643]
MLTTLKNAWKIPDLRKRMLFTLLMLVVFRLGANIPVPGIDKQVIAEMFKGEAGGLLDFMNLMAGGAFKSFTIFALNIYPYITASIIIQLLTIAIPSLEALAREGEEGRKKLAKYTRYGTVVLALIQAIGYSVGFFNRALISKDFLSITIVVATLTAGTAFLMWLGEQITDKGIGNGISLIIFTGIISRVPGGIAKMINLLKIKQTNVIEILIFLILSVLIIAGVVAIQEGQRRIPVQYAKRVVGRKMYGGQSTHIPLKVLMAGVIPVIFSTSLLAFPQTLAFFFKGGFAEWVNKYLSLSGNPGVIIYSILNAILIIFFTYFYTAVQFNPYEYANNLKQYGGFIPGIRPGKPTAEYLNRVISKITLVGAITLALIAALPTIILSTTHLNIRFGGTALLIVVGVALETMKQIEAQMLMRHYKGFLK